MYEVYENTVRFEETDPQGVVFYGNYATFLDEAITSYLDAIGISYKKVQSYDWDIQVVKVELTYRNSARFGDKLVNAVRVATIGDTSITFEYQCRNADNKRVLVDGNVVHVVLDDDGEPKRVPTHLREAVDEFQKKTSTNEGYTLEDG